jgi:hypothetical protein
MLVNRFSSLLVACFCVFFAQAKTVTQLFNLDPGSHLALSAINSVSAFAHSCGTTRFLAASTNVDGASISFAFKGTGLTLNVITDKDRGLYTITIDDTTPTVISGVSTAQACTPIFTRSNLAYGDHVLTIQSKNQTLDGGTFSAKLEYLSIDYTVPDDATTTGTAGPSSSTSLPITNNQDAATSNALSGGTIAGVVISVILFIVVLVLAFLLYKAKTSPAPVMGGMAYGSGPELIPKSPAPVSFASTPYVGHAEPMPIQTPYDQPPPSAGFHQPPGFNQPGFNQPPGASY